MLSILLKHSQFQVSLFLDLKYQMIVQTVYIKDFILFFSVIFSLAVPM